MEITPVPKNIAPLFPIMNVANIALCQPGIPLWQQFNTGHVCQLDFETGRGNVFVTIMRKTTAKSTVCPSEEYRVVDREGALHNLQVVSRALACPSMNH
eukprot:4357974-Amphidinium_carterae.1